MKKLLWNSEVRYGVIPTIENQLGYTKLTPSQSKILEYNTNEELFNYIASNTLFRIANNTSAYMYIVIDNEDDIQTVYFGNKDECMQLLNDSNCGSVYKMKDIDKSRKKMTALVTFPKMKDIILDNMIIVNENKSEIPKYIYKYAESITQTSNEITQTDEQLDLNSVDYIKFENYDSDDIYTRLFDILDELKDITVEIKNQKQGLKKMLKACDLKTLDWLHDIEFNSEKMSACQGYKFAKEISQVRIFRRKIKDKLEIINSINENNMVDGAIKLYNSINSLSNREYRQRIKHEMFDVDKINFEREEE